MFPDSQDLRETQESQVPVDFLEIGETLDLLAPPVTLLRLRPPSW